MQAKNVKVSEMIARMKELTATKQGLHIANPAVAEPQKQQKQPKQPAKVAVKAENWCNTYVCEVDCACGVVGASQANYLPHHKQT